MQIVLYLRVQILVGSPDVRSFVVLHGMTLRCTDESYPAGGGFTSPKKVFNGNAHIFLSLGLLKYRLWERVCHHFLFMWALADWLIWVKMLVVGPELIQGSTRRRKNVAETERLLADWARKCYIDSKVETDRWFARPHRYAPALLGVPTNPSTHSLSNFSASPCKGTLT